MQELEASIAAGDTLTAAQASSDMLLRGTRSCASLNPLFQERRRSSAPGGSSDRSSRRSTSAGLDVVLGLG